MKGCQLVMFKKEKLCKEEKNWLKQKKINGPFLW